MAYQCVDSFKVFDVASISAPILVYNTTKAVAQIKASKLVNDPFISFVEARTVIDTKPATFAYVKVVDKDGVRELGISSKFLPNRSIYLGSKLVLRVNEAESNLQMYDIVTQRVSSFITIQNTELTFDLYPKEDSGDTWTLVAC